MESTVSLAPVIMRQKYSTRFILAWIGFIVFYFAIHLWGLTRLPVFADEAIYIRWAQLIISDAQQYLFFPLNDGKTPLFIWLLVPFELVFKDPLWAGRLLAVLIGFGQVLANGWLVKKLGGKTRAVWLAYILTAILPFWYFYHRQALIDSLLTLLLTLSLISTVGLVQTKMAKKSSWLPTKEQAWWILGLGGSLGLAFLTKVPAVLMLPVLPWWVLFDPEKTWKQRFQLLTYMGVGVFVGLVIFALLKVSPSFGQLFSRGSDFLYPVSEILAGKWRETLPNIPTYFDYFMSYAYAFTLVLFLASIFGKKRRTYQLLFWSALVFFLPIAIMGKVVYARYFLPVMIFATAAVSLYVEHVVEQYVEANKKMKLKMLFSVVIVLLLANIIATSITFIWTSGSEPDKLPLPESDRIQYLTEWSSGHGIKEVEAFIREQAQDQKVAVATEGFFGTLPDGLFMYFASQPDPNVYIEGIGQPVRAIPDFFVERSTDYPVKYLVVNSHRMNLDLPRENLVFQVCRPDRAPCLQVWDISSL